MQSMQGRSTFRNRVDEIKRRWVAFAIAWLYLKYWDKKADYRERLHQSALSVFGTSGLVTLFVLIENVIGADRIHQVIRFVSAEWPLVAILLEGVFLLAVAVALWLHATESKKPAYEYAFASCAAELTVRKAVANIPSMLKLFYSVFERSGAAHVSVAHPSPRGLVIEPNHVYPPESDSSFFEPVPETGVAGRVLGDGKLRYVPRLFFPFNSRSWRIPLVNISVRLPTMKFPHSISYAYDSPREGAAPPRLAAQEPDLDSVAGESFVFCSFLSIPLRSAEGDTYVGVLNFDFRKTDPIWKPEIEMALVLATLFADQHFVQRELSDCTPREGT